jgi:RecA/RadA recombinase
MAKLSDIRKAFRKSVGSTDAAESSMVKVTEYLDSGSYAINRVLTGDIHKGFPLGRISTIYGESGSGKSLLAANAIVDALKNKNFQAVYYFDSEGGGLFQYIENQGVNLEQIEHITVHSIEDCAVKILQLYDSLVQAADEWKKDPANNDEPRILCVLDSFGALAADKLIVDAAKDKMAQDMGLGPKLKNNMMRGLMMRVVQSNCPLIIINHTYADPGAMFTSKVKNIPGGEGIRYASHVMLQMTKLLIKSDNLEFLTGKEKEEDDNGYFKGNRINAFCVKNRVVKPCFSANMFIDFSNGIAKYDGLIEDAVRMGFIEEVRGGYVVKSYSDKKITYKELVSNSQIWDTFIEKFNDESIKRMAYSSPISQELDAIESEINNEEIENG